MPSIEIDPDELAQVRDRRDQDHRAEMRRIGLDGAIAIRRDDFTGDVEIIVDDATIIDGRVMAVRGQQRNQDGSAGKRRWVAGPGKFEIVEYRQKQD